MRKTTVEELLDLNERIVKANEELIRVNENAMRIIGNLVELLKQSRGSEVRTLSKQDRPSDTCDGYHDGSCWGTKEREPCSCGGDKSKCDFYEHVRQ